MSAPTNSNTGGHPSDRGIQQTPLDSNQHGQAQNIIDETKDTYGATAVDRNIGEAIDGGQGGLSGHVNDVLNQPSEKFSSAAQGKAEAKTEEALKVGQDADFHDLAASKQP
ncbi:hypothetical protein F5884DRAFT_10100 [Xylogone sp. PMI_703]|nr:hypothetical protein F5884DRAFT_10100 [Xylogone sp. PMI_703]